jgi:hypothetical protein
MQFLGSFSLEIRKLLRTNGDFLCFTTVESRHTKIAGCFKVSSVAFELSCISRLETKAARCFLAPQECYTEKKVEPHWFWCDSGVIDGFDQNSSSS